MNLEWTYAETMLWIEIALCTLLLLPMITREMWREIFDNRYVWYLKRIGETNFNALVIILAVVFYDASRDWRKYSNQFYSLDPSQVETAAGFNMQMHLFKAQRNFYVTGVCLVIIFVIKRLFTLVASGKMKAGGFNNAGTTELEQPNRKLKS